MRDVVLRGTGTRANLPGYSVFGKTGTAQKLDPQTGTYSADKYVSSFLCGAPAAAPRVIVLVVVDEPTTSGSHYGGTVAAPAAAEILRQTLSYLRVPRNQFRRPNRETPPPGALRATQVTRCRLSAEIGEVTQRVGLMILFAAAHQRREYCRPRKAPAIGTRRGVRDWLPRFRRFDHLSTS